MGRSYLKYHVTKDGLVKVCRATVRDCPYAHYDTKEDAMNRNVNSVTLNSREFDERDPRVVTRFKKQLTMKSDGYEPYGDQNDRNMSLKNLVNVSNDLMKEKNLKVKYPLGDWDYDFGGDVRLKITRHSKEIKSGVRDINYIVTYWSEKSGFDPVIRKFNVKDDSNDFSVNQIFELEEYLSEIFVEIADTRAATVRKLQKRNSGSITKEQADKNISDYDKTINKLYRETVSDIRQVEMLSKSPNRMIIRNGITIFDRTVPGELALTIDMDNIPTPVHIITDAIEAHAWKDSVESDFSFHFTEKYGENSAGTFSLTRVPQGNWFVSYNKGRVSMTREIPANQPEHPMKLYKNLNENDPNKSEDEIMKSVEYYNEIMPAIESSIEKYRVNYRNKKFAEQKASSEKGATAPEMYNNSARVAENFKNTKYGSKNMNRKGSTAKKKLFGLFG